MNPSSDRELLRALRGLARLQPDRSRTEQIMRQIRRTHSRRLAWRGFALAAMLAIAITVAMTLVKTPSSVAAAAELSHAVQTTAEFKGWVHLKMKLTGPLVPPSSGEEHFGMEAGVWARANTRGSERTVEWCVLPQRQRTIYQSARDQITINDLDPAAAKVWGRMVSEKLLGAADFPSLAKRGTVTCFKEASAYRYEVTFPNDRQAPAGETPQSLTIWRDAKTDLVQHVVTVFATATYEASMTYDQSPIEDIYALGVPRATKVKDLRLDPEAATLLNELARRSDSLGNYSAVLLNERGIDRVSGRVGDAFASMSYDNEADHPPADDWRTMSMEAALKLAAKSKMNDTIGSNGRVAWSAWHRPGETLLRGHQSTPDSLSNLWHRGKSIPHQLWPGRLSFGIGDVLSLMVKTRASTAEVLHDPARPDLIGLKVIGPHTDQATDDQTRVTVRWFDTAHQYAPTSSHDTYFSDTELKHLVLTEQTTYTGLEQTEDGRWYPSRWATKSLQAGQSFGPRTQLRLILSTQIMLDPSLFCDPLPTVTPNAP